MLYEYAGATSITNNSAMSECLLNFNQQNPIAVVAQVQA
jgi:hypothetical protein